MELPLLTFDEMADFLLQLQTQRFQDKHHHPQAELFITPKLVSEDLIQLLKRFTD